MFCGQIISSDVTVSNLRETVESILFKMEDLKVHHIPVADDEKFLGLIAEDDLQDSPPSTPLSELSDYLIQSSVQVSDYFLVAVKLSHVMQIDVIPVLNEKKRTGRRYSYGISVQGIGSPHRSRAIWFHDCAGDGTKRLLCWQP